MDSRTTEKLTTLADAAAHGMSCYYLFTYKAMASAKQKAIIPNHTLPSIQPKKITVMRKNQKVARVSLYCKLNMLVPQLQRLSGRTQGESADKSRNANQAKQ